jgi:MtN3 and saliva related transmembrane protein
MSYPDFLQLATLVSGIAMSLSPIFQIKLILQRKSSADVAIGWPLVILVGVCIWLLNGIYLDSTAIIISEVIGIITNSLAVALILYYRSGGEGHRERVAIEKQAGVVA